VSSGGRKIWRLSRRGNRSVGVRVDVQSRVQVDVQRLRGVAAGAAL